MKGTRPPPTIMPKIAVEREYIAGIEFIRHVDETGIGKIRRSISIFMQNSLDLWGRARKLEGNLKEPGFYVCQNCTNFISPPAQQVAALGNDGLTSGKRAIQTIKRMYTFVVSPFALIKKRKNHTCINQYRFHP